MPAGLMGRRAFAAPVTAELLCQIASTGVYFSAPLFLHEVYGVGVTETALLMVPLPVGMCVGAVFGGRLTARIGERSCGMIGAGAMAVSMAMFLLGTRIEIMAIAIVALAVQGAANGLVRPPMASAAGAALDQEHFGVGMATMRMIGQLGSAVGISMAVTAQALSGFGASYTAALLVSLGSLALMTRVVNRPGLVDRSDRDAQRRLLDEIETDAALSLPALEG
jgi:DHA2 family methylenomycin A resistance protein-like MFS transporter